MLLSGIHPLPVPQTVTFGQVHGSPLKSTFPIAKDGQRDVCKNWSAGPVSWVIAKTLNSRPVQGGGEGGESGQRMTTPSPGPNSPPLDC